MVSFDEDRIDAVRGGVIQQIHDLVDPRLPEGIRAHYNGSLEISKTYNRITLDNQRKFTPPILLVTIIAIYLTFRSWRKTVLTMFGVGISLLWTLGLYSLLGYTFNVLSSMLVPLIGILAIADDAHHAAFGRGGRHRDGETAFRTRAHIRRRCSFQRDHRARYAVAATSNVVAVRAFASAPRSDHGRLVISW